MIFSRIAGVWRTTWLAREWANEVPPIFRSRRWRRLRYPRRLEDAKEGRPACFWAIFTEPALNGQLIRKAGGQWKVFIIALIIDIVYRYIVFRWFIQVKQYRSVLLALVPYL